MIRFALLLFWAAVSGMAAARPVITEVVPRTGPAGGGYEVTITGSDFDGHEAVVSFGALDARVTFANETTLRVIVPPNLPRTVDIHLLMSTGQVVQKNAFTYTGPIEESFDRILLPIFTFARGAFGSRFRTELQIANPSSTEQTLIFGLLSQCVITCLPIDPIEWPVDLTPGYVLRGWTYNGTPGRFAYVPKNGPRIIANLRVFDDSRSASNFGTELPVVYDREFTSGPIKFLGIPSDPRFRTMLRIYAAEPISVLVYEGNETHYVTLRGGATLADPAYAELPDVHGDVTVIGSPWKVWAFVSVTNNETQAITTITPHS